MDYEWRIQSFYDENIEGGGAYITSDMYPRDQVIVYDGIYGIPPHFIWYCLADKSAIISFLGKTRYISLLIVDKGPADVLFSDIFFITEVKYDLRKEMYVFFGIQQDYYNLMKSIRLTSFHVNTLKTPEEILEKLFEINEINMKVINLDTRGVVYKYNQLSFDSNTNLLEVVDKICNENFYEWYIYRDYRAGMDPVLLIGDYINPDKFSKVYNRERLDYDLVLEDELSGKLVGLGRIFKIGTYYRGLNPLVKTKIGRILWTKGFIGRDIGALMTICMTPNDVPSYRDDFIETLEGRAREIGETSFREKYNQDFIVIGRSLGDKDKDKYMSKTFSYQIKDPHSNIEQITFEDKDPEYFLKNIQHSSPFAGNNVGLLFPQIEESNHLLLSPIGKRHLSLIGPSYWDSEMNIPKRNSEKDFRLSFTNGWTLYVDKDGNTLIRTDGVSATEVPSGAKDNTCIKLNKDGTIDINTTNKNVRINEGGIAVSLINHTHNINTHTHPITPGALIPGPGLVTQPSSTPTTQGETDKHSKNLRCESHV